MVVTRSSTLTLGGGLPIGYKGVINCSANPNYPAAVGGDMYIVSVAGKIGGASGPNVVAGDAIIAKTVTAAGDHATVGANWDIIETNVDFSNVTITGGTINGTTVGATTPAAITGTTLSSTGDVSIGDGTDEKIDWNSGNVTYVPIGGNIETYAAAATAGDTLILAAGTYTVTDDIDITQAVNIVGQGIGQTTVTCATDAKNVFDISADNVRISGMTVNNTSTSGTARAINVSGTGGSVLTNVTLTNLVINVTNNGTTITGILYDDAGGTIRDVVVNGTNTGTNIYGVLHRGNSSQEANDSLKVYNLNVDISGSGTQMYAYWCQDNNSGNDSLSYIYNSRLTASGATTTYGGYSLGGDAFLYAENCVFSGSTFDVIQATSATLQVRNCTLVGGLTSGTITYDGISQPFAEGRIIHVPLNESIEAYHNAATAGDTLVLSSGTYTITDDIDISKAINIVGQGVGQTTVNCATNGINMFDITADNVRIANLSITHSGAGGTNHGIRFNAVGGTIFSGCRVWNVVITMSGAATNNWGIAYLDAGGEIRNVTITISNSTNSYGLYMVNAATAEANTTLNVHELKSTVSGATTSAAIYDSDNSSNSDSIMNLYNSTGISTTSTTSYGLWSQVGDSLVYAENCVFNGSLYDVATTSSGFAQLRNCTLVNGTTTGTIVYEGMISPSRIFQAPKSNISGASGTSLVGWFNQAAQTYTDSSTAASGTAASFGFNNVQQPTLAATNSSVTTTDAATLYIANAPAAGTNMTLTNPWALWVDSGASRFDGNLKLTGGANIVLDTSTGTKIGTATNQLLGFYNATPVDQPATVSDPSGGATQDAEARTAISAIIDRLQELGLIA